MRNESVVIAGEVETQWDERSPEERSRRWLAVLIAFVTLLVGITTFLQADASARSARLNRAAQQDAIASTGLRARGQEQYAFSEYVAAREYDDLRSQAQRLTTAGAKAQAAAYITASEELTRLTPLLGPDYAKPRASDGWRLPDFTRYEVNTWVISATMLSQQREASANEANAWDGKSNNYIAAIAIFAVVLFLFGLASTLGGVIRWMFVSLGIVLTFISMLWVVGTAALPVKHAPARAFERYAQGEGALWQAQNMDAVQRFSEALAIDSTYANAYSERGYAHLKEDPPKVDEAIKDFQAALNNGSDKYQVYWNLGWAYYLAGNYEKSIPYSVKALDVNTKVCGPAFNIAVAYLAAGNAKATDKAYHDTIARCEKIMNDALKEGLAAPVSVWTSMQGAVNDIEDLMCQAEQKYCYPNRDKPSMTRVNKDAMVAMAETYRKRVKEALTALEFAQTSQVKPGGAQVEPLRFGSKFYDADNKFQSYIVRDVFPDDRRDIYALFNYTGLNKDVHTIWKVFYHGREETGMRYDEPWALDPDGNAEKKLNYRFILKPGHYDVELYGNGELLSTGSLDIGEDTPLPVTLPSNARPSANVSVGNLSFADDFVNNHQGWWTGTINRDDEGRIEDNAYVVKTTLPDSRWRVTCEYCGGQQDVYYEANTRYRSGPTNWGYGLSVRADAAMRSMYLFVMNGDGQFAIGKLLNGTYSSLSDWATSSAIRKQGENRLGILARGTSLEFFINGQSVKRLSDSSLSKGYFGFSVERTDLEVSFSQVRVWQVK